MSEEPQEIRKTYEIGLFGLMAIAAVCVTVSNIARLAFQ